MSALVVTLTVPALYGIALVSALLGGTLAVLGPKFLAYTELRRAEREIRRVFPGATVVKPERRRADW